MKISELKRVAVLIGVMLIFLTIGFFVGRNTIETKTITKLETGQMVSGSVNPGQFVPISEEKPDKPLLPYIQYRDTGTVRYMPIDSAAYAKLVIADYELKRTYKLTAFDNKEQGKMELFPVIQYNRLTGLDYNFTPIVKNNYIYKEKVWQPFLSGSYSTLGYMGIGGGVFYHNIGFEYQYQIDYKTRNKGHLIGGKYMF